MQIAQKVVKAVSDTLPFSISLSDEEGYIVGATDPNRIGTFHTPSKEVLMKQVYVTYEEEDVKGLDNILPGIAAPLNFMDQTIGVLGIIGPPDEVRPHAELIKKYVEIMWQETFYQQLESLESKTVETFVQSILLNGSLNLERFKQYCRLLKLDYKSKCYCIIIDIGDSLLDNMESKKNSYTLNNLREKLINCVNKVFEVNDNSISAFLNTEKIVVLKAVSSESEYFDMMKKFQNRGKQLKSMFNLYYILNVTIASGNICSSFKEINHSYHEAELLVEFGKKRNNLLNIYSYYDWQVLGELLPSKLKSSFASTIQLRLKKLVKSDDFEELKLDFITYCDNNMNISEAAKKLFIHRNTLIYRLKKIETLTSLDTRSFQHCTLLYIALKQSDL